MKVEVKALRLRRASDLHLWMLLNQIPDWIFTKSIPSIDLFIFKRKVTHVGSEASSSGRRMSGKKAAEGRRDKGGMTLTLPSRCGVCEDSGVQT